MIELTLLVAAQTNTSTIFNIPVQQSHGDHYNSCNTNDRHDGSYNNRCVAFNWKANKNMSRSDVSKRLRVPVSVRPFIHVPLKNMLGQYVPLQSKLCKTATSKIEKSKILITNGRLMKVERIAECSLWSILQYFWPALSDYQSWNQIFDPFENDRLTQVLLYFIWWNVINKFKQSFQRKTLSSITGINLPTLTVLAKSSVLV